MRVYLNRVAIFQWFCQNKRAGTEIGFGELFYFYFYFYFYFIDYYCDYYLRLRELKYVAAEVNGGVHSKLFLYVCFSMNL